MNKIRLSLCALFAFLCGQAHTEETAENIERAWDMTWSRFYLPSVQTFGDYLSSYDKGKEQAHLPTADEVKRQYPNPCGYSTGMEDGAILGGTMLSVLCDRFAVTKDDSLRKKAAEVFAGLKRCVTVHGVKGFVARNVCPEDAQSTYINSSRDQVTHSVHGLWQYYQSPLPDEAIKQQIRTLLADVAERMIETVTPENDYDFLRADGQRCPLGICRMWNVQPHEAARLPMIYAAAWEVTREERYREQWRRYAAEAIEQSAHPGEHKPAYALLQMQCSLEVLHALEPEAALKATIHQRMIHVRDLAAKRFTSVLASLAKKSPEEMRMLGPDWRTVPEWKDQKGYPNPQWGPFREIWHLTREAGESALILLMVDDPTLTPEQQTTLTQLVSRFDYTLSTQVSLSMDSYYTHLERGGTYGIGLIEGYACGSIVQNNTAHGFYSGIAIADGYEDKNCFEEGDFLIQRNTVTDCVRGFTLYKNPQGTALGRRDLKLQIVDNEFT